MEPCAFGVPKISAGRSHLHLWLLSFVSFQLRSDSGWTTHESSRLSVFVHVVNNVLDITSALTKSPQQGKQRSDLSPQWPCDPLTLHGEPASALLTKPPTYSWYKITENLQMSFLQVICKMEPTDEQFQIEGRKSKLFPTETQNTS